MALPHIHLSYRLYKSFALQDTRRLWACQSLVSPWYSTQHQYQFSKPASARRWIPNRYFASGLPRRNNSPPVNNGIKSTNLKLSQVSTFLLPPLRCSFSSISSHDDTTRGYGLLHIMKFKTSNINVSSSEEAILYILLATLLGPRLWWRDVTATRALSLNFQRHQIPDTTCHG